MRSSVKCVTWNVLADSYCNRNRSINKTASAQSDDDRSGGIYTWSYRCELIRKIIVEMDVDVLCLQEADHLDDFFAPLLQSLDYGAVRVCRSGRRDGCLVAWRKSRFELIEDQEVLFDDLATYNSSDSSSNSAGGSTMNISVIDTLLQDFARQNVAVMVKLRPMQGDLMTGDALTVACTHLHWNPNKAFVKLAQAQYLLAKLGSFSGGGPVLLAGDFNSLPDSEVYRTLLRGFCSDVSAPPVDDRQICNDIVKDLVAGNSIPGLLFGADTKFLCDYNLNKLCRYMRILGLDVALEPFQSKELRSVGKSYMKSASAKEKHRQLGPVRLPNFDLLFNQAREENRVILTSSKDLMKRSACPQSMFVKTNDIIGGIVDICRFYHIALNKDRFLTVCGKCGGKIEVMSEEEVLSVTVTIHSDRCYVPQDREVFQCVDCRQPYWWNDSETSSPARAMKVAHELFDTVTHRLTEGGGGGGGGSSSSSSSSSSSVILEEETDLKAIKKLFSSPPLDLQLKEMFANRNKVVQSRGEQCVSDAGAADATQQQELTPLRSAVAAANGHEPAFTNTWDSFRGTLDYIFASPGVAVEGARVLYEGSAGVALPSAAYPSDHLPVEAILWMG